MGIHASPSRLRRELAAVSPMQSNQSARDIADFFRPYARTQPTVPQKRTSPFADRVDDDDVPTGSDSTKLAVRTPSKSVSFRNATPKSQSTIKQSFFSPATDAALPIRSPRTTDPGLVTSPKSTQRNLFKSSLDPPRRAVAEVSFGQNTSFTFSDISERSQTVLKDGKVVVVLGSDEEDDGGDTDSLQSLDDILGRRDRNKQANEDHTLSKGRDDDDNDHEKERISILSKFTNGRSVPIVGKDKIREIYAKERSLKFDLSRILNDHFGDLEASEKINRAREDSDDEVGDGEAFTDTEKKLLAQVVLDGGADKDPEDVNRVMIAVERTEALAGQKEFSFFGSERLDKRRAQVENREFPAHAIPNGLWNQGDDDRRSRMFLSGLLAEIAAAGKLSPDALRWIFNEAVREQRQDLQQSYVTTLRAGSPSWTRLHLTADDIQKTFQRLGAAPDVLQDKQPIIAKHSNLTGQLLPVGAHLLTALSVLNSICADMDMITLSKLSSILIRLCIDDTVMSHGRICVQVKSFLLTLLSLPDGVSSAHVSNRILSDASQHLRDPMLQARLLSRLPVGGQRASRLRKSLADVFLLGPSVLDSTTKRSNVSLQQLHKHIGTSPAFTITRRQDASPDDYARLTALVSILDVAIGAGGSSIENFQNLLPTGGKLLPSSTKPHTASSNEDAIQKSFNASIDALADLVHGIFVSIKDTGASHMRRTEAKDALQALEYRLLFSVRIGVRKKKHVFDSVRTSNTTGRPIKSDGQKVIGMSGVEFRGRERAREAMGRFLGQAGR